MSSSSVPGNQSYTAVLLRFSPQVTGRMNPMQWHISQTAEPAPDGGLFVQFEIRDLRELLRWVLWWGADCEAVAPDRFRAMIREELEWMLEKYQESI